MYSTCLFCNAELGRNQLIESFPVGRRLAFDEARGRLWVVCRRCERWNLSAVEERWEAIEECQRLFGSTRLRVSTENIGLARLKEGLELVRIGSPQRPELAAWRYGDQFGRRRRAAVLRAGLGLGALGVAVLGGAAAGVGLGGFGWWVWRLGEGIVRGNPNAVVARVPTPAESTSYHKVRRRDLGGVRLVSQGGEREWRLQIALADQKIEYGGEQALRAAGLLLPAINRFGGSRVQVARAVEFLERAGSPGTVFKDAAWINTGAGAASVAKLPYPMRLALEMAAHEDTERRALEGELQLLEHAWKEAEEIAAISDSLLLPGSIDEQIRRLRGETAG